MQIKTALTAVLLMVSGATAIATDACEPRMQLPQQLLLQKWLELQVSRRSFGQRARLERK
ncbi:hypothetical protein E4U36_007302 [Claviceps purpurea]|nr:hypothetical protein E4U36_007302 [Claviceps purpurea]